MSPNLLGRQQPAGTVSLCRRSKSHDREKCDLCFEGMLNRRSTQAFHRHRAITPDCNRTRQFTIKVLTLLYLIPSQIFEMANTRVNLIFGGMLFLTMGTPIRKFYRGSQ